MMRYKKLSINSSFISFYQNSHAGNCSARLTSLKSPFSKEKKISIWYLLINYWIVLGQHTLYWKASLPLNSQKILHPWLKRHDLNQSHPLIQHANLYRQIHPTLVDDVVIYYVRMRDLNSHEEWTFKTRYSELTSIKSLSYLAES